jgi:UDP-N-acetylmuramoylalanine--D-glutamate ligase
MELARRKVLVVGAGKSGVAAANFCAARGARVTVTDRAAAPKEAAGLHAAVQQDFGGHDPAGFAAADLIVLSPGVPPLDEVAAARARGVEVTGEIELASCFIAAPIVAVTGTNGKSTVTALAGEIAAQTGRPSFVGGNLGTPLVTCVDTPAAGADGLVVVELSSFQLETCETLRPRAAALLNLTPDHLDRYPDLEAYGAAKLRIAQHMGGDDVVVVNADSWFAGRAYPGRVQTYSTRRRADAFVDGDVLRVGYDAYPIAPLHLFGRHNLGNALAALLLMRSNGLCSEAQARAGLESFRPLPHRMQLVGERRGVRWFDDSKATNVDSVVAALDGIPMPFVLIAGGRDKGGSYAPLRAALQQNTCRAVILIGEAADRIADALGDLPTERAPTLPGAVRRAAELARAGDAVLLSPACSSFDMFENYHQRGEVFAAAVAELPA